MQITHDLAIGGLQQVVVNICRTIDREKFNVSVLCLRSLGEFALDVQKMGINVFCLRQKKSRTDYFSFFKVAKILRHEKIEIIHTHNTQPFFDGTIGALLSDVKTIIHTDHARDFPDKRRYMFAEWLVSHFAHKVVGVSEQTSNNLIKYDKISPRKIITIPNGVDGSKFPASIDKVRKKKELRITRDGPIIGLCARLTKEKGITFLLQSMPQVINVFPDVSLIIAGEGPLEVDLKRECFDLGIEKYVFFVGPRLDIPELLKLFDVYVLPSVSEGLPMVLLEAMGAGCPIVATDVGGISMAIKHGKNGSLVRPKDPKKLVSQIIKVLLDRDLREQYSQKGLKMFREKFSAEMMTKKYEQLYLRNM